MLAYVVFAVLAAILLWFLIGTKGKWQYKLPLIILVPYLGFLFSQIPDTYRGWPTVDRPAVTSTYIGGIVEEPDPVAHTAGVIYIWVIPAKGGSSDHGLGYKSHTGEPRSYKLPYSRELHKEIDQANGIIKKDGRVAVKVSKRTGGPHSGSHVPKFLVRLYELPPGLPPKAVG